MQIEIAPETERLVREELNSGHFQSVDEVIVAGVRALRDKSQPVDASQVKPKNLDEVCALVRGLADDLDFSRNPSTGRDIDLR